MPRNPFIVCLSETKGQKELRSIFTATLVFRFVRPAAVASSGSFEWICAAPTLHLCSLDALRRRSDPSGGALCPTRAVRTGTSSTGRPFAGASARSAWTVRTTGRAVSRGRLSVPSTSTFPGSWTRSWTCVASGTMRTRRPSRRRSAATARTATVWACPPPARRPLHCQHLPAPGRRGHRRGRAPGVVPALWAASIAICLRSKTPKSSFWLAPGADDLYAETGWMVVRLHYPTGLYAIPAGPPERVNPCGH